MIEVVAVFWIVMPVLYVTWCISYLIFEWWRNR